MAKKEAHDEVEVVAEPRSDPTLDRTAEIVRAYLAKNHLMKDDIVAFIGTVHAALKTVGNDHDQFGDVERKPSVPIKKSIGDDYIVCLEDGKRLTMLKRYLMAQYGMTPEQYRKKWDLPHDYPMVAPSYARLRSAFAKKIGLGRVGDNPRRGRRPKTP
jgi:predicted transcriptional regulator